MTEKEFESKQALIKRYEIITGILLIVGLFVFVLVWSFLFPREQHDRGTEPLFAACFTVCFLGGWALFAWINIRHQRRLGAVCPKCGKRFYKASARKVMATHKCGRCDETIITD